MSSVKHGIMVLIAAGLGIILAAGAHAQSSRGASHSVRLIVQEVAVLALDDSEPMELRVLHAEGSTIPSESSYGTRTLRYTTIIKAGTTRSISVQWSPLNAAPRGTSLRIAATSVPDGCGVPSGEVKVSSEPQSVIAGIPSCATGTSGKGAQLGYWLVIDDKGSVDGSSEAVVTVMFTVSDS